MTHDLKQKNSYRWFNSITTRWMDNDQYGHVNNVTYYSYFDTATNKFLINQGGLDVQNGKQIGYIVDSRCQYYAPIAYPETITVGLSVERIGTSSVTYLLAIFKEGEEKASAQGAMTHVFVNRETGKPEPIAAEMRAALESLLV
jgi:acyl-CoA thioester hydrolase